VPIVPRRGRSICPDLPVIALSAQATSFVNPNPTQQTTIEPVMNWKELIAEVTAVGSGGGADGPVTGVEYDSRKVRPGAVLSP